jgi:hypothetical protein
MAEPGVAAGAASGAPGRVAWTPTLVTGPGDASNVGDARMSARAASVS